MSNTTIKRRTKKQINNHYLAAIANGCKEQVDVYKDSISNTEQIRVIELRVIQTIIAEMLVELGYTAISQILKDNMSPKRMVDIKDLEPIGKPTFNGDEE